MLLPQPLSDITDQRTAKRRSDATQHRLAHQGMPAGRRATVATAAALQRLGAVLTRAGGALARRATRAPQHPA